MNSAIQVVKRDGAKENFEQEKIARVLMAAGLERTKALGIATSVENWILKNGKSTLTSLQIKDRVLEELRLVDTNVANLFAWYEKTKE